jgi:hypothetical protein
MGSGSLPKVVGLQVATNQLYKFAEKDKLLFNILI